MVNLSPVQLHTSIITPAHIDTPNKLIWLDNMVKSVLAQSRGEWELIIVDDCSPIPVKSVWDDSRVKIYRLDHNVGTCVARNTAVFLAKNKLILPLDADDMLYHNSLELLYNNWKPHTFVYGNVDLLVPHNEDKWTVGTSIRLPDFNCDLIINPKAAAPVTCLHLKQEWEKAGGWKNDLQQGLEDVEYWISLIRTTCTLGHHIDHPILMYRKHETSRTRKMQQDSGVESNMKKIIRDIHSDIKEGADMGCGCGGGSGRRNNLSMPMTRQQQVAATSALMNDAADAGELVVLQYVGPRGGSFGVVGQKTRQSYKIQGTGATFLVHQDDLKRFTLMGRPNKPDFIVIGRPEPEQNEINEPIENKIKYEPDAPKVADTVMTVTTKEFDMTSLPITQRAKNVLIENNWTIEKLAIAKPGSLLHLKWIGQTNENRILKHARQLYFGENSVQSIV